MNRKELFLMRAEVEMALLEREALGEFDANAKHMILLLRNMRSLIEHAIDQTKVEKK